MYPHAIHLRHPWRQDADERSTTLTRRFNTPTGLEPKEAVWIVVDSPNAAAALHCNNQALGTIDQDTIGEFEITGLLQNHNEIELKFTGAQVPPDFTGVRLEIRLKSA